MKIRRVNPIAGTMSIEAVSIYGQGKMTSELKILPLN